ncbi:DUF551 domain-containing protein [Escherichia coli]|jgi:hypothetical protein|uniref:DUF551 domain-containing protein n=2 Tax=Escherichia coli TaxID=562 RepID=UPI000539F34D|nr:DUF551 domain-containing protein [Escherichia coli]EMC9008848.1 DUF551 domain-containing protein [Shigella sonnei]HBC2970072.1 DUF551 domain-containing protein [Escherichia coli O146]HDQ6519063.1 DUF551 domain-containing protein [Escherichia coli O113:H4]HDQ6630971.1 DUF551 domain-containing protein [Escherichia coli O22:H16]HDQ6829229.1 DUF551 domain-containing protein [Escherichia coli O128:H2]HDQ6880626.1 DUF551 domain-containing protein [Escherichia coli O174:H8]HDQ6928836.1 DUF551 do
MSTITREWLQQAINDYESVRDELPFGLDDYQGNILASLRIALASLEAEPVAWKVTFTQIDREYNTFTGMYSDKAEVERWVRLHKACNFRADITPLYTAKPVPVTPDGWISCSERMPDTKTAVLVAREFDRKGDWRMKWATYIPGHPDANDGWVVPGASWIPSHWMPLPEPPKEVRQ